METMEQVPESLLPPALSLVPAARAVSVTVTVGPGVVTFFVGGGHGGRRSGRDGRHGLAASA
ncbi:hypothetical protein [Streptomyces albogriseolus]|uniref:hypothetical protein n=1 Tax=Streptomyces albogriseolus TaxID=1887 RepID=UPI003460B831